MFVVDSISLISIDGIDASHGDATNLLLLACRSFSDRAVETLKTSNLFGFALQFMLSSSST
jgi:hypothetical protein